MCHSGVEDAKELSFAGQATGRMGIYIRRKARCKVHGKRAESLSWPSLSGLRKGRRVLAGLFLHTELVDGNGLVLLTRANHCGGELGLVGAVGVVL